ncbi:MAG: hypothetical protein NC543_12730 [bacterium]|nr:hypothetical protein [bacterium]MCM1374742.1 hypothetical protein [Muribaculum sp.]
MTYEDKQDKPCANGEKDTVAIVGVSLILLVLLGLCLGVIWQKGQETPLENVAERGKRPYGAEQEENILCLSEFSALQPPEDGAAYIIVQWASEADIDLYVYSEEGEGCVGQQVSHDDEGGSFARRDNADGSYELVYLEEYGSGEYTLFLRDCSQEDGGEESRRIEMYIVTAEGVLHSDKIVLGRTGALYEYARIREGELEKRERYVDDMTDYGWAARDKHDPYSWIAEAQVKYTETWYYTDQGERYKIAGREYDRDGELTRDVQMTGKTRRVISETRYESRFDENGNLLMKLQESYTDGVLDSRREETYDLMGEETSVYVYDADGSVKGGRHVIQYDEEGRVLSNDFYRVGKEEMAFGRRYIYDSDGHKIYYGEYGENGVLERSSEVEYDEEGRLVRKRLNLWVEDGLRTWGNDDGYDVEKHQGIISVFEYDGHEEPVRKYVYDGRGALLGREETEYDADGNELWHRCYDEEGVLTFERETRWYGDGEISVAYYTYWEGERYLDMTEHYENAGEGRRKSEYLFIDGGTTPYCVQIWEYDIGKRLTYRSTYDSHTWEIDEYTYDEKGNETSHFNYYADGDLDGNLDDKVLDYGCESEYDEMGNQTSEIYYSTDQESGEVLSFGYEREYDEMGNQLSETFRDTDGAVRITTWEYLYDEAAGTETVFQYEDGVIQEGRVTAYYP